MAEPLSPLENMPTTRGAGATLREAAPTRILRVQAWPDTLDAVRSALADLTGFAPPTIGRAETGNGVTLATTAPGTFMLAGSAEVALAAEQAAVTDLSHGRVILTLDGENAVDILQRCVTLDLAEAAFPVGRVTETAIHHVGVLIHRRSATRFGIWMPRSFAQSLAEWLLDAGLEAGIGLGH